ncbi:MAG: hypothetical protein CMF43_01985 [Legionellales bacterium]|nr:hypothetical protein [Legionellales bacterium]
MIDKFEIPTGKKPVVLDYKNNEVLTQKGSQFLNSQGTPLAQMEGSSIYASENTVRVHLQKAAL